MELIDIKFYFAELKKIFDFEKISNKFDLYIPDEIFKILHPNVEICIIDEWERFEYGYIDFDESNFYQFIFSRFKIDNTTNILLLTDEGLIIKKLFSFVLGKYNEFVEWYEEEFNMEFMQPFDYVVLIPEQLRIIVLSSSGALIHYQKGENYSTPVFPRLLFSEIIKD